MLIIRYYNINLQESEGVKHRGGEPGLQDADMTILKGEEQVKVQSIALIMHLQNKSVNEHTHTHLTILGLQGKVVQIS